jgi:two-component system nitrogen regulation sensor histidine kinase GlnL
MIKQTQAAWVIDNLSTAVLLFDASASDGGLRLDFINAAGEHLLSASARKVLGRTKEELFRDTALVTALGRVRDSRQAVTEWGVDLMTAWGTRIALDFTATPLFQGTAVSHVVLEMINADRYRRVLRDEALVTQQNAIRTIFEGMAHEIKNPLGGIRGAAQLLERERPEYAEYTRLIVDEVDRLKGLVDRMLAPNQRPRKRATNIHEVLEHVRSLCAAEAPLGLTLERDYDPSLPPLLADRDQLIQAFLNIVRNAVQALDQTGKVVLKTRAERQITLGIKRHRMVIRVDIVDDGPGVPAEVRDDIFYPMVSGRADGTGLGLSIAQGLIYGHGGSIEFTSERGETRFTVRLPTE